MDDIVEQQDESELVKEFFRMFEEGESTEGRDFTGIDLSGRNLSGLNLNDLKKLISEKRVMYDHTVDQKGYKWSGKSILKNINIDQLPEYIRKNTIKFKNWLD